ncbi:MAG: hypothetical protein QNJ73_05855 [Gammaproteobacteria bacterium]|nr:hypothetical protein [Gammaproteobacteria bacterium]
MSRVVVPLPGRPGATPLLPASRDWPATRTTGTAWRRHWMLERLRQSRSRDAGNGLRAGSSPAWVTRAWVIHNNKARPAS